MCTEVHCLHSSHRYAAPLYVDMKKVERTTAEDGSVSEEVDDYPKVFIGEVSPVVPTFDWEPYL